MNPINTKMCLGIDPNPNRKDFESFKDSVYKHMEILSFSCGKLNNYIIKPQLAYFLLHGSKGLLLLEELVAKFQKDYTIILDGKFNDISTTLKAYLDFAFVTLGVHGITISPFLGEKSIELAVEQCVEHVGKKGRVYVLCATSENSHSDLSYIQDNWRNIVTSCKKVQDNILANDPMYSQVTGVVIAANREEILFSQEFITSQLSALCPGIGAQGADWNVISKSKQISNEMIFPFSRAIFSGGNIEIEQMYENIVNINKYFQGS